MTNPQVEELAEKYGKQHSERAAALNMCDHCEFVAAIREAYDVGRRDGLEEAAKIADAYSERYGDSGVISVCKWMATAIRKLTSINSSANSVEGKKK